MEESLFLIQDRLNTELLNKSLRQDEYNYNLLISYILGLITTYIPNTNLSKEPVFLKFDETYLIILTNVIPHITLGNLNIYLEIKDNIIIKIEASILE